MESKKVILKVLLLNVVLLLVGLLFALPQNFGLCASDDWSCISSLSSRLGEPLTFFTALFIPSVLLVLLFRNLIYETWKRIAIVYVPLALILVALVPVSCGGFISSFCLNKENASWLTAGGFLIITLILIIGKKLRSQVPTIKARP